MKLRDMRGPGLFTGLLAAALLVSTLALAHGEKKKAPAPKKAPSAAAVRGAGRRLSVPRDYPGIQRAVDAAAPFDTVEVAAGVYTESVVLSSGQRGLVLRAPAGPEQTILQGSGDARLITFDEVDTLTTLEGFTLRNGGPQFDGGALYAYHSKILIRDCVFGANHTPGDGGALALYESEARLERSRIEGNSARRGGGIFVGGGRLTLLATELRGNTADVTGGGLFCDDGSVADTAGCRFLENAPTDLEGCAPRAGSH